MDNLRIIILILCLSPSLAFASVYNFSEPGSGALRSTPLGNTAHPSSGNVSLESGRIRSTPQFTFGTETGKQVGFTASRLSTIATSRVGATVATLARSTTPIGIGITAAVLICDLSEICDDGNGNWEKAAQYPANEYPLNAPYYSGFYYLNSANGGGPTLDAACAAAISYMAGGYTGHVEGEICKVFLDGTLVNNAVHQPYIVNPCTLNYIDNGSSCDLNGNNDPSSPSDSDWDNVAPLLNDDGFAQPLLDAGQPVPVGAPDAMPPQNFITSSETTTLRDAQGNVTGSQVTERRVDITDVSDANNPNSFDITEKKTVTNYDINNNIVNSETTIINNEQPANEPPEDITIDDVEDVPMGEYDFPAVFSFDSWGEGSCPADPVVSTSRGTLNFTYQPLCDFAIAARPIILAVAGLAALLMIAGLRKEI